MILKYASLDDFLVMVAKRDPDQPEFLQAVKEVMTSLWPFIRANPQYAEHGLLERLVEPERVIQFRVAWVDDRGQTHVNRAFRVQHSSAIGPFKGGMRFHPSVNLSILKFLGFEQTFKNALTTLPMGGGKGGSDFDPKGKSDGEVMRFCQALMLELYRHLGSNTDVPAGDIGVGAREVGFMAGMMKKLSNDASCVFTGKGIAYGGSLMRPEATGYGTVYFAEQMLRRVGKSFNGMTVSVSGSGNVAQYAVAKAMEMGAKVITVSDSGGTVYDRHGFNQEKLEALLELKNVQRGRLDQFARQFDLHYEAGKRPWHIPAQIALPCATQNELDGKDARNAGQEWRGVRGGRRQHAVDAGRGGRVPEGRHAVRAGQGQQRRRRRHLGSGNVAERAAPVVAPCRSGRAPARDHEGHPRKLRATTARPKTAASIMWMAPTSPASSSWPTPCWRRAPTKQASSKKTQRPAAAFFFALACGACRPGNSQPRNSL